VQLSKIGSNVSRGRCISCDNAEVLGQAETIRGATGYSQVGFLSTISRTFQWRLSIVMAKAGKNMSVKVDPSTDYAQPTLCNLWMA
jgi:hypothetical protein